MEKNKNYHIDIEICQIFSKIITQIFKDIDEIFYISKDSTNKEIRNKIGSDIFIIHLIGLRKDIIMKDIVDMIGLPNSTATRRIEYLVGLKLVKRVKSKEDHRKINLRLTREGRKLSLKYFEYISSKFKNIFTKFSISERQFLKDIFQTISIQ